MKADAGIWDRLTRIILFLLVLAVLLGVVLWYVPLIRQNERMRQQILKLTDQIKTEEEKAAQLKGQIDALRSDPRTIERHAREQLGYAKPGETVIRFSEPATNNARPNR